LYPRGPRGSFKSGRLEYRFETAWAPPVPWMDVVAAEHPKLYFELEFEFEMGWGDGLLRWRRGKQLKPQLDMVYISPKTPKRRRSGL
jgi:Ferredoxin-like domain in Api92-like protein